MKNVYIVMTQTGWDSDHVSIEGVYASQKEATKAIERFYKAIWEETEETPWPGLRKADYDHMAHGGIGAWTEIRRIRKNKTHK